MQIKNKFIFVFLLFLFFLQLKNHLLADEFNITANEIAVDKQKILFLVVEM